MVYQDLPRSSQALSGCKLTAYLIPSQPESLTSLELFMLVREGFAFDDVAAMVSASELYSAANILRRITGNSTRSLQGQRKGSLARLNPQQSALAFRYAQALEHAAVVFGSQRGAEEWLARPCRYLEDDVPLTMIENPFGFRVVEEYLLRIEMGVYQ